MSIKKRGFLRALLLPKLTDEVNRHPNNSPEKREAD